MQLNIYRQNSNGEDVVVGMYDNYKKLLNIYFSRTKDEFAGHITIKEPIIPPSVVLEDLKAITLIDKDFDGRYEVTAALYKEKSGRTEGPYKGKLNFKISELKKVR